MSQSNNNSSSMYNNVNKGIKTPYSNGSKGYVSRNTTPSCKVCIDAGKTNFNHYVKNLDGSTNCPTLLSQDCRYCKIKGHTAKYCPILTRHQKEDARQTTTTPTRPEATKPRLCFTNKNVFATLAGDSDEEEGPSTTMDKSKQPSTIMGARGSQPSTDNFPALTLTLVPSQALSPLFKQISYASITKEMEYQQCGDFIYDFITTKRSHFAEYAPRLTGMLMEQLTLLEIQQLVKNEKELDDRISEGIQVMIMDTKLVPLVAKNESKVAKNESKVAKPKQVRILGQKRSWCGESSDDEDEEY